MSETEASAQLATTTVEATPTQGAPASNNPPTQEGAKTGSDEVTLPSDPKELMALVDDLASTNLPSKPKEAAKDGGEPAPTEEPPKTEEVEQPPATQVTEELDPESTEVQTEEAEPTSPSDPAKKPPQYRYRPKNEVDAMAMDIIKRAEKSGVEMTMETALTKAKEILRKDDAATGKTAPANAQQEITEAQAEVDRLWQEHEQAYDALDLKKAGQIMRQIDAAKDKVATARAKQTQQLQEAQRTLMSQFETSKVDAVTQYPDLARKDSALTKGVEELDEQMRETGNPLYNDPRKPLILAQMVANNLRIAPKVKGAKPAASSQPANGTRPVQPAKPPVPVMNGAARTTPANPQVQAQAVLDNLKTPEDVHRLMDAMELVGRR